MYIVGGGGKGRDGVQIVMGWKRKAVEGGTRAEGDENEIAVS